MKFSWQRLKKPFFVLAPMEDVTDTVFRRIMARHSRPDLFMTEFTNTDALASAGEENAMRRLQFTQEERPIIAQIWGTHPESFYKAAQKIVQLGFDGIDINMGCPQRDIIKDGSCSALVKNPNLAKNIIEATKKGSGQLPVSVKTRIGFATIQTEEWVGFLLEQNLAAITIHARTAKEMSAVPAHWEEVKKVVRLRDQLKVQAVVIGNGDVMSREDGLQRAKIFGADGIMIGRGVFHDLFAFKKDSNWTELSPKDKLLILKEHVELFAQTWGEKKNFALLKKYFKIYINGFPGANEIRLRFMETGNYAEAIALAEKHLSSIE